jgi:hypothetical protein
VHESEGNGRDHKESQEGHAHTLHQVANQ